MMHILSGMKILIDNEWISDHALIVEGMSIIDLVPQDQVNQYKPNKTIKYPTDHYLIPGLIDCHIHGANGFDVMDATPQALTAISNTLAEEGVTGFLATTMTAPKIKIEAALKNIASAPTNHSVLGIHLEGPFISSKKAGAQQKSDILDPDIHLLAHWQSIAKNRIKIVTLAPELPQANTLIKALNELGIIASIGHTDADFKTTEEAISAGAHYCTHLWNAMRGIHQREPGAVGALLLSENVYTEVIADGIHLHPAILALTSKLKPKDKIILVSDAMRAKCLANGNYDLGGQNVHVKNSIAKLADGTLAGSTLKLNHALKNFIQSTGFSLIDTVKMASTIPAKLLKLEHKGSIKINNDADLVVLDKNLQVQLTMQNGNIVFTKKQSSLVYDALLE